MTSTSPARAAVAALYFSLAERSLSDTLAIAATLDLGPDTVPSSGTAETTTVPQDAATVRPGRVEEIAPQTVLVPCGATLRSPGSAIRPVMHPSAIAFVGGAVALAAWLLAAR